MMVVIASELPPAVRGRMKLWFIEPRPNVFVSGIKDALAERIIRYLLRHCPTSSGLMIFLKLAWPLAMLFRCWEKRNGSLLKSVVSSWFGNPLYQIKPQVIVLTKVA